MPVRRLAALLALLLAFPVVAHAQGGAGDDQYQDPFGNSGGNSGTKDTGSSGSGSQDMPPLSSAPPASAAPAPTTAPSASAAQGAQLAATGADPALMALLGAGLVLGGSGLRLRLRLRMRVD